MEANIEDSNKKQDIKLDDATKDIKLDDETKDIKLDDATKDMTKHPIIQKAQVIPSFDDFEKEEEIIDIKKFKDLKVNGIYYVKPEKIIPCKFGKTLIIEVNEVIDGKVSKESFKVFTPKSYMAKMMQQYKNCKVKHWLLYKGMTEDEVEGKTKFDYNIRRI